MELRPLGDADEELLVALEEQDDVWEFLGALPLGPAGESQRLFAVIEGGTSVGIAGLVRSPALEGRDFELVCAMKSEVQLRGLAKQACQLVLRWAFYDAKMERVIACIDDSNTVARSIATKLGMETLGATPPGRTVYVKYRA
jgi:RimJ/RimL family protein N-acetyltransferase